MVCVSVNGSLLKVFKALSIDIAMKKTEKVFALRRERKDIKNRVNMYLNSIRVLGTAQSGIVRFGGGKIASFKEV